MTALVLFPSRVRFVNDDGTLTAEAYRALTELMNRTGGILGSSGSDTYSDVVSDSSKSDLNVAYTDVQQSGNPEIATEVLAQQVSQSDTIPDIVQAGPIGINATITTASLVGKTVTIQDGVITGFA
jgi:hypothetical protein